MTEKICERCGCPCPTLESESACNRWIHSSYALCIRALNVRIAALEKGAHEDPAPPSEVSQTKETP
jgi:hypothetical protein